MKRMMCVWIPNWPVQRVRRESRSDRPLVLYAASPGGAFTVTACSRSAARGGVRPGISLGEAEALWAGSAARFTRHDRDADRVGLRKLAIACDRYTPVVAIEEADAPECLLLDITGSSHLFGGERKLAEKAIGDLRRIGYTARIAIADGIGASWALAHALSDRRDRVVSFAVVPAGRNRDVVAELGVEALRLSPEVVRRLQQFDLRHVRQLLALPRGDVAARFGLQTLVRLDQALGIVPEILVPERHVEPVRAAWQFEEPVSHPHILENVLGRLIRQIVENLAAKNVGVQRLQCTLMTADKSQVEFTLGLLHPTLSVEHLIGLMRLRLEAVRLPAAVASLKVWAAVAVLEVRQPHWFGSENEDQHRAVFHDFVERISNRLGEAAVLQPCLRAEEQPEFAGEYVPWLRLREQRAATEQSGMSLVYPVDLLANPLAIHVEMEPEDEHPRQFAWRQRSYVIARAWGPQRIEAGWWRGHDIRRDYYRVEAQGGERFWLFRDRTRGTWFLHGIFA